MEIKRDVGIRRDMGVVRIEIEDFLNSLVASWSDLDGNICPNSFNDLPDLLLNGKPKKRIAGNIANDIEQQHQYNLFPFGKSDIELRDFSINGSNHIWFLAGDSAKYTDDQKKIYSKRIKSDYNNGLINKRNMAFIGVSDYRGKKLVFPLISTELQYAGKIVFLRPDKRSGLRLTYVASDSYQTDIYNKLLEEESITLNKSNTGLLISTTGHVYRHLNGIHKLPEYSEPIPVQV